MYRFVTILSPACSNWRAFCLNNSCLCNALYVLWQNIINSYQLWKKRKKEIE